uniref:Uncharacterized protein n=1 Tax=Arundo donax TaxID=35708 RepID=A0A0A9FDX5_ARUDO
MRDSFSLLWKYIKISFSTNKDDTYIETSRLS